MKRTIQHGLLLVLAFLLFSAEKCNKNKYEYSEASVIEIVKTPCYGKCPEYSFRIQGNGEAEFKGKRNVPLEGTHQRTFPVDTANYLFSTFVAADLWQYDNEYTEQVTDLPTTYLSFTHDGKTKKIKMYYGYPEELDNLAGMLQELAFSKGWEGEATGDK